MTKNGTPRSVQDAAAQLGLTPRAIRHRIKAGTLPAVKLGNGVTNSYVIQQSAIDALLAKRAAS